MKAGGNRPANPNGQRLNVPPQNNPAALHLAWQVTGDKSFLESLYASQIENSALREYINTEGSLWIDRVDVANAELQRARLGGLALVRNSLYPGHAVSWTFAAPANDESAAILVPNATAQSLKIVAYNLNSGPVKTTMTAWDLAPGRWELVQGVDSNNDDSPDGHTVTTTLELERSSSIEITLPPRVTTILNLKLISPGTPYWSRPDLGIGKDDVVVEGRKITVTVHSLGAVDSPPAKLALVSADGRVLATAMVPGLRAPTDLFPKTTKVTLTIPAGSKLRGSVIVLDPDVTMKEITRLNNRLKL